MGQCVFLAMNNYKAKVTVCGAGTGQASSLSKHGHKMVSWSEPPDSRNKRNILTGVRRKRKALEIDGRSGAGQETL